MGFNNDNKNKTEGAGGIHSPPCDLGVWPGNIST